MGKHVKIRDTVCIDEEEIEYEEELANVIYLKAFPRADPVTG